MYQPNTVISCIKMQKEYVQHIYDTGKIPDKRPVFDDLLGKQVSNLEKWICGASNQPLAIIQSRIRSTPVLSALLSDHAREDGQSDDKRFVIGKNGKRI